MPLYRLPLMEIDGRLPCLPVIPAAMLNAQLTDTAVQRDAHKEATAIVKAARRKAEAMIREARTTQRQRLDEAYAEFARYQHEYLERAEAAWLAQHVISLCEAAAAEQCVVHAVASRIQRAMGQVLSVWFAQQSVDDLLCAALSVQVEKLAMIGSVTLQIHPERETRMRDVFGERVEVVSHPALALDEALLSSSRLCVSFSLSRHLHQVLRWVHGGNDAEALKRDERLNDENA